MKLIFSVMLAITGLTVFSPSTWADISEATFTPQGSSIYPSVPVSEVEVFVFKPDFNFKIIGVIEARGCAEVEREGLLDQLDVIHQLTKTRTAPPGEKEDIALAMDALKTEAANAGATGVVIIGSRQVRVSQNSTERQIKAAAIRRTNDGTEKYTVASGGYCDESADCVRGLACGNHTCTKPSAGQRSGVTTSKKLTGPGGYCSSDEYCRSDLICSDNRCVTNFGKAR